MNNSIVSARTLGHFFIPYPSKLGKRGKVFVLIHRFARTRVGVIGVSSRETMNQEPSPNRHTRHFRLD